MENIMLKSPDVATYGVRFLWEGFEGDTFIVVPALDTDRMHRILATRLKNNDIDIALQAHKVLELDGRLWFHGDAIARGWIENLVSQLYDLDQVHFRTVASIIDASGKLLEECVSSNLVLLGGPSASPATKCVADKLNDLKYWFRVDEGAQNEDLRVSLAGHYILRENSTVRRDYGLVVKRKNPWNNKKRIMILAGLRALGTQAAAASLCISEIAQEILEHCRQDISKKDSFDIVVEAVLDREGDVNFAPSPYGLEHDMGCLIRVIKPYKGKVYSPNPISVQETLKDVARNAVMKEAAVAGLWGNSQFPGMEICLALMSLCIASIFGFSLLSYLWRKGVFAFSTSVVGLLISLAGVLFFVGQASKKAMKRPKSK